MNYTWFWKIVFGLLIPVLIHVDSTCDVKLFRLPNILQELDSSLEEIRRHIKHKEQHEEYLKVADKTIQKLSSKYHPDKVKSKGGSDEELAQVQKMQTILNATRSVLNSLTRGYFARKSRSY